MVGRRKVTQRDVGRSGRPNTVVGLTLTATPSTVDVRQVDGEWQRDIHTAYPTVSTTNATALWDPWDASSPTLEDMYLVPSNYSAMVTRPPSTIFELFACNNARMYRNKRQPMCRLSTVMLLFVLYLYPYYVVQRLNCLHQLLRCKRNEKYN